MSDTRNVPTVVSEPLQSSVSTTGHTRTDTVSVFVVDLCRFNSHECKLTINSSGESLDIGTSLENPQAVL